MSRSYREPYYSRDAGVMSKWKNVVNRSIRRKALEEEIPDGRFIYKLSDKWDSPGEDKHYFDCYQLRRK